MCEKCKGKEWLQIRGKDVNEEACKSKNGAVIVIGQTTKDGSKPVQLFDNKDNELIIIQCPECNNLEVRNYNL